MSELMTLAISTTAAAIGALTGLAIARPFLYVRLVTPMWVLLGMTLSFGCGVGVGGKLETGFWIAWGSAAGMGLLYVLGHVAAASLNAKGDQEAAEPNSKARKPEK